MQPDRRPSPTGYRLRVDGHLGTHWGSWFNGFTLTHEPDGTTTMTGDVADQAELHGLLARVRDLGLTLIRVESRHPATDAQVAPDP